MTIPALDGEFDGRARRWLLAAFAFALLLQLELVFNRPVNWDEFYHLTETHAFAQGRLTDALQVLYARLFFWIPLLPLDSIDQIRLARLFMFAFELFTTFAIYAMGSRFAGRLPAAFAALAYLTGGYVFQHGFSYRADPMAAALLMGSLWILLARRLDSKAITVAGILAGLAVLATIKVVFYAPAFAAVAWWRWDQADDRRAVLLRLAGFAGAAIGAAILFVGLTILSLPDLGARNAVRTVSSSGTSMFSEGLFPRWHYVAGAMAAAPVLALLILTTPVEIARAKPGRARWIALAGFLLPLASLAFYRNSFPYFYAFILPPVMVAVAIGSRALLARFSVPVVAIALTANAAILSLATPREVLASQRQVIGAVHTIFPRPVAYFDFPGMIVDFPKANFFMTTWGMQNYQAGRSPSFLDVMSTRTVPLLVANQGTLERNQAGPEPAWELSPEDATALRDGYVHHWGPLWVAGRRFAADIAVSSFPIYAPGTYTLEGAAARIDGTAYGPGQTVTLGRGTHRFERVSAGETLLRWDDHLARPAEVFAGGPVFRDF